MPTSQVDEVAKDLRRVNKKRIQEDSQGGAIEKEKGENIKGGKGPLKTSELSHRWRCKW